MEALPHHWFDGFRFDWLSFHNLGVMVTSVIFLFLLSYWWPKQAIHTTKNKTILHTATLQTIPQAQQLEVRPLQLSLESNESSLVLARSFKDDPVQIWLKPDPETRINELFHSFKFFLKSTSCVQVVIDKYSSDCIKGVCLWKAPYEKPTMLNKLKMWLLFLTHEGINTCKKLHSEQADLSAITMIKYLNHLERVRNEIMGQQRFCHLIILGVDAPWRGQGIGKVLVQPGLDFADKHGLACYLESSNPRNITFYESIGFERKRVIHFDMNDLKSPILTCMVRPARTGVPISQ